MDGQRAYWVEYFELLYATNPPRRQLPIAGLQMVDADPPIDGSPLCFDEVRQAVARLRGGKAPGVCYISSELLKLEVRP